MIPYLVESATEDDVTGFIRAMRLENVFGDIKSDCSSVSHGRLPQVDDQHLHLGTWMPSGGVHSITHNGRTRAD
jgi:hypothetical protein